jgi:serine/threonine protein phosphatase PrpC
MSAMQYKWESRARTDKGNVRKHNEDAFLELSGRGVWVVADGMGGHRSGDVASQLVVDLVENIDETDRPSKLLDMVEDALIAANRDLFAKSLDGDVTTVVGSTVAALIVVGEYTITAWAGDSRVYRLREGVLEQISRDHSEVEELIEQGVLTRASAEDHPAANVITRAVGGAERLYLDMELLALKDRDRFLLCSDGLYKELTEQEIAFHLGNGSCAHACERLMEIALARECSDNVTALVVDFRARAA